MDLPRCEAGVDLYTPGDSSATDDHEGIRENGQIFDPETPTVSSRSSISSLPTSVAPSAIFASPDTITPTRNLKGDDDQDSKLAHTAKQTMWRNSPFRHSSSVHNMQMRDEDDDELIRTQKKSRHMSRNTSGLSSRSSRSVRPRRSEQTLQSPAQRAKVKKEFPLVLLHCSLLPPALPAGISTADLSVLRMALPEEYWQRWELLSEKVIGSSEVQTRGVLIPHPQADYELLEERLLESLELARPRLRSGHFLGDESASDDEESDTGDGIASTEDACPDCGKQVAGDQVMDRKWEVKVYAANGLMRAGAWSAAWNEMEKVDVEVGVWLPAPVRRMVEERCLQYSRDLRVSDNDNVPQSAGYERGAQEAEERKKEIYGSSGCERQAEVDGLFDAGSSSQKHSPIRPKYENEDLDGKTTSEPGLPLLLLRFFRLLARDRRNLAIVLLGFAVLFYATRTSRHTSHIPLQYSMYESQMNPAVQSVREHSLDESSIAATATETFLMQTASTALTSTGAAKIEPIAETNQDSSEEGGNCIEDDQEEESTALTNPNQQPNVYIRALDRTPGRGSLKPSHGHER